MPRDCQLLMNLLISIKDRTLCNQDDLDFALENNVYFNLKTRRYQLLLKPKNPLGMLHYLSGTVKAVRYFTSFFPDLQAYRHADFQDRRLSAREIHRLERSLMRFEICCALTDAWTPSQNTFTTKSDAEDNQVRLLSTFLNRYLPWELEELACVYDFLELAVFQYNKSTASLPATRPEPAESKWIVRMWESKSLRFPASILSRSTAAGLTRILPEDLSEDVSEDVSEACRAAARARILSLGLVFLQSFQARPLEEREEKEKEKHKELCYKCAPRDDFIHAAIHKRTDGGLRYESLDEKSFESNHYRRCRFGWIGHEDEDDDDNDGVPEGAHEATPMWKHYATDGHGGYETRGGYFNLHKFRSWGYGIWDDPLQNCQYSRSEWDPEWDPRCHCHSCSYIGWEKNLS